MQAGMEVIDREREKESLEQMYTVVIFVCLAFFVFSPDVLYTKRR